MIALAALALLAQSPAPAAPATVPASASLIVRGLDGHSETLTADQLASRPHVTASLTHDGHTTAYSGVALAELLRDVDAPLGVRMHGKAVSDVVVVSAADGYRVALSLGEVDPGVRPGARVIVADQSDGHALDAKEGPFRLVVDGDAKPARSARQVVEIDVKAAP